MPAYWRTVAGPRTGPRVASRPQRTLRWTGHGWTLDTDMSHGAGYGDTDTGTGDTEWQIGRGDGGSFHTVCGPLRRAVKCQLQRFGQNVSVIVWTQKYQRKHFVLLISIYPATLSQFCPSSRVCQMGDWERTTNMICCCWTIVRTIITKECNVLTLAI